MAGSPHAMMWDSWPTVPREPASLLLTRVGDHMADVGLLAKSAPAAGATNELIMRSTSSLPETHEEPWRRLQRLDCSRKMVKMM